MFSANDRFRLGLFADPGDGSDIDEAFEDAVDNARVEYGLSGVVPSVAATSAADVKPLDFSPSPLARAHVLASRITPEEGVVYAIPLASDSQFKRRRPTIRFEDEISVGSALGFLPAVSEQLEKDLLERLPQEVTLAQGEFLESVELRSYRARFKPVVSTFSGPKKNLFVVTLKGSDVVLGEGATAGEARRAALLRAKEGPLNGLDSYVLEVSSTSRRADGNPLYSIERQRLTQKGALRLTLSSPKKTPKITGWLFFGQVTR